MFNQIAELLGAQSWPSLSRKPAQLQVAVAALLVQAAATDDQFDPDERAAIQALLATRFGLGGDAANALMAKAATESARSVQLYTFTRIVVERLDSEGRIGLIEMLWEVAYADGVLSPDEDALLRRVAGLIYVSDYDRGAARKRVLQRRGFAEREEKQREGQ